MDEEFEEKIRLAKKNRQRRLYLPLAWGTASLIFSSIIAGFWMATELRIIFEGPEIEFEIKKRSGSGFFIGSSRFFSLSDKALLEVKASNYKVQPVLLSAESRAKYIDVPLKLLKKKVEITSTPKPLRPTWKINGDYYSSDMTAQIELKPGNYTLELQAANIQNYDAQITVPFSTSAVHRIAITPQTIMGHYNILTQPAGAQVMMNGKRIGVSPITGTVPAGDAIIKVEMNGFETVLDNLLAEELVEGVSRNYVLKAGQRKVSLNLKPSGGQLYLNGTKISARSEIAIVSKGESRITYMKEGYASRSVLLNSFSDSLNITLKPTYSNLVVTSNPPALVKIDGVDYGNTPLEVEIKTGQHKIELQKSGYKSLIKSVKLVQGATTKVSETLLLLSDFYRSTSRAALTNSIGIELIRLQPKAFTMGAPRSQVGQRANEIQRRVAFDRSLYMSKYEVTEAQYSKYLGKSSKSKKPVTQVSWEQAALFCNWLSRQEGLPPFYVVRSSRVVGYVAESRGYRMPSEAEWEYVAKYHKKSKPSIFVWGDTYKVSESAGNIADRSAEGTVKKFVGDYNDGSAGIADVGSFKAEKSGFHDMSGNVSEWVHDAYILTPNSNREFRNYLGEGNSSQHVIKGSNYLSVSWQELRSSFRETASSGRKDVGFRIARYIH